MDPLSDGEIAEKIRRSRGRIFNNYEEAVRVEITDPAHYPIFDPNGFENRMYSEAGEFIPRTQLVSRYETPPSAGVLLRLNSVTSLFEGPPQYRESSISDDPTSEDDDSFTIRPTRGVTVYPQAFLPNLGHVKANRLMHVVEDFVDNLNCEIDAENEVEDGYDSEEFIEDLLDSRPRYQPVALTGIANQFYNEYMHRVTKTATEQHLQKGLMSAALVGSYSELDTLNKRKANTYWTRCERKLPYQRQFDLVSAATGETDRPTGLRAENVCCINMRAMSAENRTGLYVFFYFSAPLH